MEKVNRAKDETQDYFCPIRTAREHSATFCKNECALYGACIKIASGWPTEGTLGKPCILMGMKCIDRCKFYDDGCMLSGMVERIMEG